MYAPDGSVGDWRLAAGAAFEGSFNTASALDELGKFPSVVAIAGI